jgi:hypothetical protein
MPFSSPVPALSLVRRPTAIHLVEGGGAKKRAYTSESMQQMGTQPWIAIAVVILAFAELPLHVYDDD